MLYILKGFTLFGIVFYYCVKHVLYAQTWLSLYYSIFLYQLSIDGYTFYSVSQEKVMDEIDQEARVRAPKTGANWTVVWSMCSDYTPQNVGMGIAVIHPTANRGRHIHVLSYWMIWRNRSEFHYIHCFTVSDLCSNYIADFGYKPKSNNLSDWQPHLL